MKIGISYQNLSNEFITYMAEAARNKADEMGIEPVSYTHLDVYKRQGEGVPARAGRRE